MFQLFFPYFCFISLSLFQWNYVPLPVFPMISFVDNSVFLRYLRGVWFLSDFRNCLYMLPSSWSLWILWVAEIIGQVSPPRQFFGRKARSQHKTDFLCFGFLFDWMLRGGKFPRILTLTENKIYLRNSGIKIASPPLSLSLSLSLVV